MARLGAGWCVGRPHGLRGGAGGREGTQPDRQSDAKLRRQRDDRVGELVPAQVRLRPGEQEQVVTGVVRAGPELEARPVQAAVYSVDDVHDWTPRAVVDERVAVELTEHVQHPAGGEMG